MRHLNTFLRRAALPIVLAGLVNAPAAFAQCLQASDRMAEILNRRHTADTMVLAHRGYWGKYNSGDHSIPENSTAAIVSANHACMDGIEVDVKESQDGVLYLLHDFHLGRTTDVYSVKGGAKYNPMNNSGTNPAINQVAAIDIDRLRLLTPDRNGVSLHRVPRVSGVLQSWVLNRLSTPIIFDTKTTSAVIRLDQLAGSVVPNSASTMGAKVNATLYPDPAAFFRDAPRLAPIPVFTTNMLGVINVADSLNKWGRVTKTVEINVKQHNGLLSYQKNQVQHNGNRVGVFHAIPDGPVANAFYKNTGECCYRLSDVYYHYIVMRQDAGRDTDDRRGNLDFINSEHFGLITSDDPNGVVKFLAGKGKRNSHLKRYD